MSQTDFLRNRPYSFSYLFHKQDSVTYRKEKYLQYATRYHVRLYRLSIGFGFPELILKDQYTDHDFLKANGMAVGDRVDIYEGVAYETQHYGLYHSSEALRFSHQLHVPSS